MGEIKHPSAPLKSSTGGCCMELRRGHSPSVPPPPVSTELGSFHSLRALSTTSKNPASGPVASGEASVTARCQKQWPCWACLEEACGQWLTGEKAQTGKIVLGSREAPFAERLGKVWPEVLQARAKSFCDLGINDSVASFVPTGLGQRPGGLRDVGAPLSQLSLHTC